MTAIWRNDGSGWELLTPSGFTVEADLHTLVEQAPHILPLAGSPDLAIVGREVPLGTGYADLVAVEQSGRPVIIEVKLARNSEARRAVVSQILAYAAYLAGMDPSQLEQQVLGGYLRKHNLTTLAEAVAGTDQEGSFDPAVFAQGLAEHLSEGRFRLVLVLDQAPEELVRLVGYLESITDKLLIDLISVSAYQIGGSQVLVPQRVEAERQTHRISTGGQTGTTAGTLVEGAEDFLATIEKAPPEHHERLRQIVDWAVTLEREGLVRLYTYHGRGRWTLLPQFPNERRGLVTLWNSNGAYVSLWRSVFESRAPNSIAKIEDLIAPQKLGQGNVVREFSEPLLRALSDAYREASVDTIRA